MNRKGNIAIDLILSNFQLALLTRICKNNNFTPFIGFYKAHIRLYVRKRNITTINGCIKCNCRQSVLTEAVWNFVRLEVLSDG